MGKKSKKAKGKDASRKERLQERRERTLDAAANPEQRDEGPYSQQRDDPLPGYVRPYFAGDRVWFYHNGSDGANPLTYRGVIQEVDAHRGMLGIVSLQNLIAEKNEVWRVRVDKAFPDFCDLTLRFNPGDHVLCKTNSWMPKIVTYLWPIYEIEESLGGSFSDVQSPRDIVPHYKCGPVSRRGGHVASPSDHDSNIRKHPTAFRFSAGDSVILNITLAFIPGRALDNNFLTVPESPCEGMVTQVDITGKFSGYFVYECECSFDGQEQFKCYIAR